MKVTLNNAQQAHTVLKDVWAKAKPYLLAGNKLVLTIEQESKSRDQEEKYHAIIGEIAKQSSHLGAKWSSEDWKRFLVWQFAKEIGISTGKLVPSLDGTGIVQLGLQTRKFKKDESSQFIEWLLAWAAQNGVTVNDVSQA
jgi:hypothetical protein